jgi:cytochrome P450
VLPSSAAGRDPDEFADPDTVNLERTPNRHLTFGAGAHRCLGVHQAHMEMLIALDEFHRSIPEYHLDPSKPIDYVCAGGKSHPRTVPLVYPPSYPGYDSART